MPPRKAQPSSAEDTCELTETSQVLKKLKKIDNDRDIKRGEIKTDFEKAAGELRGRVEERLAEHTRKIEEAQIERVRRVIRAMEKRAELEQLIAKKLAAAQREFSNVTELIKSIYDGRLEQVKKARNDALPMSQEHRD